MKVNLSRFLHLWLTVFLTASITLSCTPSAPAPTTPAPEAPTKAAPRTEPPAAKAPKVAELKARSLKVTPELVFPGQEAKVEAEVANLGEVKGTLPVALTVNGVEVDSRPLTLDVGATGKVSFNVVRDLAGKYELSAGGMKANLTVAEVETYKSKSFNYSVSYPKGWTLNEQKPTQVTVVLPGFIAMAIGTDIVPVATSLEQYTKIFSEGVASSFKEWKLLSQDEVKKDGVVVGNRLEFAFTSTQRMRASTLLMKKGRYSFAVTVAVLDSLWELNKPTINASLDSFKPPVVAVGSYTDSTQGFSLNLPAGWDATETGERVRILNMGTPVGQPSLYSNVFLERISQNISAKDYAVNFASALRTREAFKIISQGEAALGGGAKGYEVIYTYTTQGNTNKIRIATAIRGTQAFTLTFSGTISAHDASKSAVDQLVRSFALVEPKPFGVSRQDSLFYRGGEIVTLDPAITEESASSKIGAIFSGLVKIGKDLKVVPDLAEKWEVSADGKTYTFYLRPNAKFHNGKPVTAQDFKYSWERALDPKTESHKARTYLGDIVGASEMLEGKATELAGVKAVDDRTLEVTIDGPRPYFLGKLAYVTAYVVDRANVARGKNWTDEPNGTGPFKLKQWKKDELLILERNENYYREPARLKNVVFQLFAGRPMMMYERGEIDLAGVALYDQEKVLDTANPLNKELLSGKALDMGYIGFNVTKPPFDDPKVRRAFALALNLDKILEVSLKGRAESSGAYVPPGIPGHNPELKPLPFDPSQAKQLITESKYGSVDRLPPVTFYVYGGAGPDDEAMVAMWKQNLGVEVKVEAVRELKEWYERSHKRDFQLFVNGWRADYVDPQNFLEVLFQSQSEENRTAYSNPEVDAALKEAAVERDEAKRLQKYQEIEKIILNDLPAVPYTQSGKDYLLLKPYVKGLSLFPLAVNHWNEVSVAPH